MVCLLCILLTIFSNFNYPTEYSSVDNGICKVARFVQVNIHSLSHGPFYIGNMQKSVFLFILGICFYFIQYLAPTISIDLLTTISIDRYLSLARPMASIAYRPTVLTPSWMIPLAWLYSVIQFLPTFYFADVGAITLHENKTVYYCATVPNNTWSGLPYLMFLAVASFVLPLFMMSILYYKVSRVVQRRQRNLSISSTVSGNTIALKVFVRLRKRVTRVLLTVVLVFLICWAPFVIYCGFLERDLRGFPNPMDGVKLGLYGLGLANSMCNPFIYFFNIGGKKTEAIRDLYLETSGDRKTRHSSTRTTSCQGGDRKISNISQSLKMLEMQDMTNLTSLKNSKDENTAEFQHWENMEGIWLPFNVWPSLEKLRESDL